MRMPCSSESPRHPAQPGSQHRLQQDAEGQGSVCWVQCPKSRLGLHQPCSCAMGRSTHRALLPRRLAVSMCHSLCQRPVLSIKISTTTHLLYHHCSYVFPSSREKPVFVNLDVCGLFLTHQAICEWTLGEYPFLLCSAHLVSRRQRWIPQLRCQLQAWGRGAAFPSSVTTQSGLITL